MYKLFLPLMMLSFIVNAADLRCGGVVNNVMDYPTKCADNLAFTLGATEDQSGSNGKWLCSPSTRSDSMLLTALVSGKEINSYIYNPENVSACSDLLTESYIIPRYLILKP